MVHRTATWAPAGGSLHGRFLSGKSCIGLSCVSMVVWNLCTTGTSSDIATSCYNHGFFYHHYSGFFQADIYPLKCTLVHLNSPVNAEGLIFADLYCWQTTEDDHPDKPALIEARTAMTDVATAINEYKRQKDLGKPMSLMATHGNTLRCICMNLKKYLGRVQALWGGGGRSMISCVDTV